MLYPKRYLKVENTKEGPEEGCTGTMKYEDS